MVVKNRKRIVLLDSHAILHRAYHALPDFSSSKGEPTGALYGLATMIMAIIKELKPDYIAAAFDLPKPTYRHEVYADYKAGRKESDEDLVIQIKRAYDFYKAFNIAIYEKEGYEADDVLGTLAEKLKDEFDVIIASGDMDTLQLVDDDRVRVYTLKKGIKDTIIYNEEGVKERFGFGPKLLPDYKGLRGDPSDNIIGISGIGEKTATTLIKEFGTIEEMYKSLEKSPDKFKKTGLTDRIINLLKENQEEAVFSKMLATIRRDAPVEYKTPKEVWIKEVNVQKIRDLFAELDFRSLSQRLKDLFGEDETNDTPKIEQKIDEDLFKKTRVALWLVNSSITNPEVEDVLTYTKEENLEKAYEKLLVSIKKDNLDKVFNEIENPLITIIENMERNGIKIDKKFLSELSLDYHTQLSKFEREIWQLSGGEEFNINSSQQLAEILFKKMGLKYVGMRKTSTGKFSTKEDVLQKLKDEHEIIEKILEYRELQKLLSTYIDNIPKLVSEDGRLHANFIQTGTVTGRMSSNNPNPQNIPIGSDRGRKIRHAFVAEKGTKLVAFDYSQIELRIAAFLSKDKKLIQVFKEGKDIHTTVAAEVFGVDIEKVDKEMRRQAKVINFGILYGMGINALKDNLGSDRKTAQEFYNKYFSIYSELGTYLDKVKSETAKNGYTTTFFGRRRYFEGIKSSLPFVRAQAERMAINAPIQGTQADLIKLSMVRIDEYLRKENIIDKTKLVLQIHDEVIYEMDESIIEKHAPKIKEIMESVLEDKETEGVPIIAEYSVGDDWGSME